LAISDVMGLETRLDEFVTNPYNQMLKVADLEADGYFSVNDELQKIDNLTASTSQTFRENWLLEKSQQTPFRTLAAMSSFS
jgi:homoserine trans-succinylase